MQFIFEKVCEIYAFKVSVWADLEKKCLKGFAKQYTGKKVFVGNGVLQVSRDQIFKENIGGIGVVVDTRNCTNTLHFPCFSIV